MPNKDIVYKTFRAEVKEVDAEAGTVNMLIPMSSGSKDRDNEIIEPSAFKKGLTEFKKRPILVSSHNYWDLRNQIGELKDIKVTDEGLFAMPQYYIGQGNEQADWGFNLASKGRAAFSVGFIPQKVEPIEEEKGDAYGNRRYTQVELLEISQVVVPSNRDAIQESRAKAFGQDPIVGDMLAEMEAEVEAEEVKKPYPNEHACRLRNPDDFEDDSFKRTEREHEGKKYSVIMGRLKGEDTMTEQAYRYDKDVWTEKEAEAHCDDHDGTFEAASEPPKKVVLVKDEFTVPISPELAAELGMESKGAISYQSAHPNGTPKADEAEKWDGAAEVRDAEVDDLKAMCLWVDPDHDDTKTGYKLPHHKSDGKHTLVWKAVAACGAIIMGGRGGVDIPDADMAGVKAHLAKHYAEFDKEPPWEKSVSQQELMDEMAYMGKLFQTVGISDEAMPLAMKLATDIIKRFTGADIPEDIQAKVGAVLNAKNLERLETIKELAQKVIDSAKHAEDDGDKQVEPETRSPLTAEDIKPVVEEVIARLKGKVTV